MARTPFLFILLAGLALLAGCTPMRWERPGTDPAVAASDMDECRARAAERAWRLTWSQRLWPSERYARDRRGRLIVVRDPFGGPFGWGPQPDRFSLERDLTEDCLQARGYQRVPVEPGS